MLIFLIRYLHSSKFFSISRTIITLIVFELEGFLYADNKDLVLINRENEIVLSHFFRFPRQNEADSLRQDFQIDFLQDQKAKCFLFDTVFLRQ